MFATSTRLFQGRVVADRADKKGESLLASTPVVVLAAVLGRPDLEEYREAVVGIQLTQFTPPTEDLLILWLTPVNHRQINSRKAVITTAFFIPHRNIISPFFLGRNNSHSVSF